MNPFKKRREELENLKKLKPTRFETKKTDDNLHFKCKNCENIITQEEFDAKGNFCPSCGKYFGLTAKKRICEVVDDNTFFELFDDISTINHIEFPDYEQKISDLQQKTSLSDAVITGIGNIFGITTAICVMDTSFLMGSMGTVVGEQITRLVESATTNKLPLVIFCASGGARMQEGILSLMQMAKTSAAIKRHSNAGLLYISVLTHPTTGGVTASFASLADITLAKPNALIGFAGPRVIEQTIKQTLPEGFQRAEYLLENGFVDQIVTRSNIKHTLYDILEIHGYKEVLCDTRTRTKIAKN
ncbi:MAG: acetyl-CoA carboxylase, carboxyltransferase subunit beta [Clostridia bacterium]